MYSVGSDGNLNPVSGSPSPTTGFPARLAIHPSGTFLFTTSSSTFVEGFAVDTSAGTLTPVSGSPFDVGTAPRAMAVHPNGNLLFVGHMFDFDTGISVHAIDPVTGELTFSSQLFLSGWGGRPGSEITINSGGTRLFCTDLDVGVFVVDVDPATGALSLPQGGPHVIHTSYVGAMTTTASGDFLFVAARAVSPASELHAFSVESSGALTGVPGSPYPDIGDTTQYACTNGAGTRLFVTSRSDDRIRVFDILADGSLLQAPLSPLANSCPSGVVGPILYR